MNHDPHKGPPQVPRGSTVLQTSTGLEWVDLFPGTGKPVLDNGRAIVHFDAWLVEGTWVESSRLGGSAPIHISLGDPKLLAGWREGVPGMKEGGIRRLIIPSDLAFSSKGKPPLIPPYSTLIYDIEVLSVK